MTSNDLTASFHQANQSSVHSFQLAISSGDSGHLTALSSAVMQLKEQVNAKFNEYYKEQRG